jgi:hypothetical protein
VSQVDCQQWQVHSREAHVYHYPCRSSASNSSVQHITAKALVHHTCIDVADLALSIA